MKILLEDSWATFSWIPLMQRTSNLNSLKQFMKNELAKKVFSPPKKDIKMKIEIFSQRKHQQDEIIILEDDNGSFSRVKDSSVCDNRQADTQATMKTSKQIHRKAGVSEKALIFTIISTFSLSTTPQKPLTQFQNIYSISRYASFSSREKKNENKKKKIIHRAAKVLRDIFSFAKVSSLCALARWRRKGNSGLRRKKKETKNSTISIYMHTNNFFLLFALLLSNSVKKREWTGHRSRRKRVSREI